jgi:hypothetical protein
MRFHGRRLAALAFTGVALALVSACGGPPPEKRSTEELLAIGRARLDEIAIPAGWQPTGNEVAERRRGNLHWQRDYEIYTAAEPALRELDERIVAAGWTHRTNCSNGPGLPCWTYDKGGLNIWPSAVENAPCPDGHPICAEVSIIMRENYKQPI